MERPPQLTEETLSGALGRIRGEVASALGSGELASFLTIDYNINNLESLDVNRDEKYCVWTEKFPGIRRMISTFPGGSWQIKTTFENFDAKRRVEELNFLASRDNSGNIVVDGQLPVSLVEAFLFETSEGHIDEFRSSLLKTLDLVKSRFYAVPCKISTNEELSFIGFPLAD